MSELEIIKSITFYGFSMLILLFAILALVADNILYSLLFSVVVFFCTGGIFFSLGADYNAVVQIAIYAVAIPILILFSIMFVITDKNNNLNISFSPKFVITFISTGVISLILCYCVKFSTYLNPNSTKFLGTSSLNSNLNDSIINIAKTLYTNYSLSLFIFAVSVVIVVVGISVLNIIKEQKNG